MIDKTGLVLEKFAILWLLKGIFELYFNSVTKFLSTSRIVAFSEIIETVLAMSLFD
jgi:hypothetical protein